MYTQLAFSTTVISEHNWHLQVQTFQLPFHTESSSMSKSPNFCTILSTKNAWIFEEDRLFSYNWTIDHHWSDQWIVKTLLWYVLWFIKSTKISPWIRCNLVSFSTTDRINSGLQSRNRTWLLTRLGSGTLIDHRSAIERNN